MRFKTLFFGSTSKDLMMFLLQLSTFLPDSSQSHNAKGPLGSELHYNNLKIPFISSNQPTETNKA